MLPDTKALLSEVTRDAKKVREAQQRAISNLNVDEHATAALRALTKPIEGWAQRGIDAAAAGKTPGAAGWPGWTRAGQEFLRGIEDLAHLGNTDKLETIKATLRGVPAETLKTAAGVAKAVGEQTARAASRAVDVAGALGGFLNGLFGRAALAAAAVLAILVVARGRR